MKHQEYQLRKFGNTYLPHRDLKPGVACSLKKYFKSGTITRELAGWIDGMAASNRYRFVYAKPKTMATKCHHWKKGKKSGTASLRTIEYALELFEALGLIAYGTIFFKGAMRNGFVVISHTHAATRQGNTCELYTLGSVWSQHFYPRPGLPPMPRPGGRRASRYRTVSLQPSDAASRGAAPSAQTGAQSSAQTFGDSAQTGAQTKEIQCANGCAIEGEQLIEKANDATSDQKFGLQSGGAEPLSTCQREPVKPVKPAGTAAPSYLSFDRVTKSKADRPQRKNTVREPKATCEEEFEGLLWAGLSDSAFFSIASDDEFNYIALDRYPQKKELRLACAKVAASMGIARAQYEGRVTNARLMADAMALLKEQGIKAPGGWYPAIKRLRAPYPPTE